MHPPPAEKSRWFAAEVQPHESALRGYLRSTFPAVRDIDDVVQESFLRIWRVRAATPIASAKAFLFQIARRLAVDSVRRERHDFVSEVRDFADSSVSIRSGAAATLDAERADLLAEAIDSLPSRCREIFIMRKLQDFSQRETAGRLGLSERTVEVQVARGMVRCGEYLRKRGIEGFGNDE